MTYPGPVDPETEEEAPGETFEGTLESGVRQGRGVYTWPGATEDDPPRAVYTGPYVDNVRHGDDARMTFPDGSSYAGRFEGGVPQGRGLYTYPNGDTYEGAFENGKRHGSGVYVHKESGSRYVGEWREGEMTRGQWVHADNAVYESVGGTAAGTGGGETSASAAASPDNKPTPPTSAAVFEGLRERRPLKIGEGAMGTAAVAWRPGVFLAARLSNDLAEYPVWEPATARLPGAPEPVAAED